MKPKEKKPEIVYRIINRTTGEAQGSYSRAFCDEFDFNYPDEARNANCHGMFKDKDQFAIAKYKVTYELLDPDCDKESGEELYRFPDPWTGRVSEVKIIEKKLNTDANGEKYWVVVLEEENGETKECDLVLFNHQVTRQLKYDKRT